jgi:DNA polymerase elongation subunit (family B)
LDGTYLPSEGEFINILLLDIETSPNTAYVWGMWKQNIQPSQVKESSYVMCWSAKWLGQEKVFFDSIKKSPREAMLHRIHTMLERADAVIHYNGTKFDIPILNKEFLLLGLNPPSPSKPVDLLKVCKSKFRFESNRLDSIAQRLKLGKKAEHEGFDLWVKCMAGDKDAWKRMEAYNRQDVVLLEKLYYRLLPWIDKHPNRGAFEDIAGCPNCASEKVQARGFAVTRIMKYHRYQCTDCGTWFRGNKTVSLKGERLVNL